MSQANISLVQSLYAAYGRGDFATIVEAGTENVQWVQVGRPGKFPGFGKRTGRGGMQEFFQVIAENVEFAEFSPQEFYPSQDKVFVLGRYSGKLKGTGKPFDAEFVHIFTLADGKLASFREFTDTDQIVDAYSG